VKVGLEGIAVGVTVGVLIVLGRTIPCIFIHIYRYTYICIYTYIYTYIYIENLYMHT
jgi:hypothetical protein